MRNVRRDSSVTFSIEKLPTVPSVRESKETIEMLPSVPRSSTPRCRKEAPDELPLSAATSTGSKGETADDYHES